MAHVGTSCPPTPETLVPCNKTALQERHLQSSSKRRCIFLYCRMIHHVGGFPKLGVPVWGVPVIRSFVFGGLYWGTPILGNYHVRD